MTECFCVTYFVTKLHGDNEYHDNTKISKAGLIKLLQDPFVHIVSVHK